MALTDTWLKANNGKLIDKRIEVTDRDGLSIRVSPKGKITFQMRYRINGKLTRLDLGSYPKISLKDARSENLRYRSLLEKGKDPKSIKSIERNPAGDTKNFKGLFMAFYNDYCVNVKTGHVELLRSFELYVFKDLGVLDAKDITPQIWMEHLHKIKTKSESIAERVLVNVKQCYNWGIKRGIIEINPIALITAKADLRISKKQVNRVLSNDEVTLLLEALDKSRMTRKNSLFIKLCLFYGCRNGELRVSKKSDFDFDEMVWTVPAENHKIGKLTGKPLYRPIIPELIPLIKEAMLLSKGSEYLFNNANNKNVMSRSSPLALPYNVMQWLRKNKDFEMEHWSIHDLRRTARTNFSKYAQPHISEIMLGHKLPGQWHVYDHHNYLDEQTEVYSKWFIDLNGLGFITQLH
ncbi:tyrosine-type recombinase/integrase [Marinicellulosiphila megalodicopiae]|uniref:tyrosine-type recombinase/integrase n=1 Tax=Marinicellulosiphila megalodicopiae TaxID=2724896 RepID=UPI003BB0C908